MRTVQTNAPSTIRHTHTAIGMGSRADALELVAGCETCALGLLRLWHHASDWVHRRVESVEFIDDRTARRKVSVDFDLPDAPLLVRVDGTMCRFLPLAVLRRKTLVNFDLRNESGSPLPLLGLRQNQVLTRSILFAWANAALRSAGGASIRQPAVDVLEQLVTGDQRKLSCAYRQLKESADPCAVNADAQLRTLARDEAFMVVADRIADNFFLFLVVSGEVGERRVVKFSYDERLSLRYRSSGYVGAATRRDASPATYEDNQPPLPRWSWTQLSAALGWTPTVVRFPVPAAESCASFHFFIKAPGGVAVERATLLAGRPREDPAGPTQQDRIDRLPIDHCTGALPYAHLHVVDVPLGSLSRAQVSLQAEPHGWLAATALACVCTTALLFFAALVHGKSEPGVSSSLLLGLSAAVVAILAQPHGNRMAARLLHAVQVAAFASILPVIVIAAILAFNEKYEHLHAVMLGGAILSTIPTGIVFASWWQARRRWDRDELSHLMRSAATPTAAAHLPLEAFRWEQSKDRTVPMDRPMPPSISVFDFFACHYGFDRPSVRVASSEGTRKTFPWNETFERALLRRMDDALARRLPQQGS